MHDERRKIRFYSKIHGRTAGIEREIPPAGTCEIRRTAGMAGAAEEDKTFGIAFQTQPWDDTGVFHILEVGKILQQKYRHILLHQKRTIREA